MIGGCAARVSGLLGGPEHSRPAPHRVTAAAPPTHQRQEGKDNKNAWRTRQNASLLLDQINHFFRSGLVQAMEHVLQERDLAVPLHIEAIQKLLAGNTTALNMNYTPF